MDCNFDIFALQDFNFKRVQLAKECFSLQLLSVHVCLFLTPTWHIQHKYNICQNSSALEREGQLVQILVGC